MRSALLLLMLLGLGHAAEDRALTHHFTVADNDYWLQMNGRREGRSYVLEYAVICAHSTNSIIKASQDNDGPIALTINDQDFDPGLGHNIYLVLPGRTIPVGSLRGPSTRAAMVVYLESLAQHLLNPDSDDRSQEPIVGPAPDAEP